MLELEHGKIQLKGGLATLLGHYIAYDVFDELPAAAQ